MRVGVLALQGDVAEHRATLDALGVEAVDVRRPADLDSLAGLIMPGGESTAIAHLLGTSGLRSVLGERLETGLPVFGTCAGMILLASEVVDGRADQWCYSRLDIAVRRNGYGRQVASFETTLEVSGLGTVPGVFIRAPRVLSWGPHVEVLASHDHGDGPVPVLVRQGSAWASAFHPELTGDTRVHGLFVSSLTDR